jgi:hypothetical protein
MKSFCISFLGVDDSASRKRQLLRGAIRLGSFREEFLADISFWSRRDYECQWRDALNRIVTGKKRSCLLTSITDPRRANFITWWPIYRTTEGLHVQNQHLFMKQLRSPFNPLNPYCHIPPRRSTTPSGDSISEWCLSVDDIRQFLKQIKVGPQ